MMKRFFISTASNVPLLKIKSTLGKQCFSAFYTKNMNNHIYFVTLSEDMTTVVLQQKISSIISDPNVHIQEFDSLFDYRESYIYIDPTIPQIEDLLNCFFVGGWEIEKGDYSFYYKITSSRSDDCLNFACFLKNFGITFSSSLEKYPVVEIENLPPHFKISDFNEMNENHLHIQYSYVNILDNGHFSTAYVLTKDMENANYLITVMNKASINNFQMKSFLKFSSPSHVSSNTPDIKTSLPQSSNPKTRNSSSINSGIPIQAQNNFYGPAIVNSQLPPNTQINQYQIQPNSYPQNQPPSSKNTPTSNSKIKEILIYPSSFARTVNVEQPSDMSIDRLRNLVEKFGKVDRVLITEKKPETNVYEVVYNKTGSCDTILKSNQFKDCTKRAEIHPSPFPISPAIEFYPEKEDNSTSSSLLDARTNTVIVALEKGEDLKPFQDKLANFGIYNRILYQLFDDRVEVAVTFEQSGSMKTLLKCKEFQNSAATADDLYKYRTSEQYANYKQQYAAKHSQQQQQQQQMQFQFQQQPMNPQFMQPPINGQFQPLSNGQFPPIGNQFQQPQMNAQFPQPQINFNLPLMGNQFPQPPNNGQFRQPPNSGQFSQPPIGNQFSQPPNNGQFSQPPNNGQFSQPPNNGQFSQPPNSGQFSQPPNNGQFSQPPNSGQFSRPPSNGQFSPNGNQFPQQPFFNQQPNFQFTPANSSANSNQQFAQPQPIPKNPYNQK